MICGFINLDAVSRPRLAHLYFVAQLLKHLPGRVWGIGYQIAASRISSAGTWVFVNAIHLVLAVFFALGSSLFVLALSSSLFLGMVSLIGCLFVYIATWSFLSSKWFASIFGWFPSGVESVLRAGIATLVGIPMRSRMFIAGIFILSWVLMYASWAEFALAFPGMSWKEGARMLALYMVAWFVGYITLISPSGLGVRELTFIGLAQNAEPDQIAYIVLVGRMSLLFSDFILGLAFAAFRPLDDASRDQP